MFIVDASVAIAWIIPQEHTNQSEILLAKALEEDIIAPLIWPFEIMNGLLMAERRRRIEPNRVDEGLELLKELEIDLVSQAAEKEILQLARKFGLSVYDAAYLDLAAKTELPLASFDRELITAAKLAKVEIL